MRRVALWWLGVLGACAVVATAAPTRFNPVSFTAVSAHRYWVLGRVCHARRCFSIRRTTDGGRSFSRLPAPPLPAEGTTPTLRFADRLDGFAFVPEAGGALYATHDGGRTWHVALQGVLAFATGGGNAYALTRYRFERSPVAANAWSVRTLPFTSDGTVLGLAAHDSHVWLLGTRAGDASSGSDVLARSRDGGRSFVTGRGPCVAGLGGELSPVSASVVWALCPTGLLAAAWRSTDGGRTFRPVRTPPLSNGAVLAPASRDTAVLARNGGRSRLLRTTDGGATWRAASTPGPVVFAAWIGFTDARVGAALVQTTPETEALWRTGDGGARWSTLRVD
jgi:photosystem II stability/assembly factor-like uncharacterized protein